MAPSNSPEGERNSLTPDPLSLTPNPSPKGEGNFEGEGSRKKSEAWSVAIRMVAKANAFLIFNF